MQDSAVYFIIYIGFFSMLHVGKIISDDEICLISRVKSGDASAMRSLYDRYVRYLTVTCARYIDDDENVRDILQDSFVKIFSTIGKFDYRGTGSLRAWMARIVVNEALQFLRKDSRLQFSTINSSTPETPEDDANDSTDDIPMPVLMEMIRKLPDGYRTVFNLYVFEDKSHKEIASILGIREDTSASQYHRAKAALMKQIKAYRKTL